MKHNPFNTTHFLGDTPDGARAPHDIGAEAAFAGRSNAGKSSALNAIAGRRSLAHTSKTPGRTRQIVFFGVDDRTRLVDLPGYGYARVELRARQLWETAITRYLSTRHSLRGVVLVMDIRHPLTARDRGLLIWCRHADLAVHVLLTKCDKLNRGPAATTLLEVRRSLSGIHPRATVQLFSALRQTGLDEARQVLVEWLELEGPTRRSSMQI
jgi:GTP-binding protein